MCLSILRAVSLTIVISPENIGSQVGSGKSIVRALSLTCQLGWMSQYTLLSLFESGALQMHGDVAKDVSLDNCATFPFL